MKFILSRTNDSKNHSKKWILGYGLLFWLISRILAMLLLVGCNAVYNAFGVNPESLTNFAGNPQTARNLGSMIYVLLTIGIAAPLLEECIFRLGLSFKRWQIALAGASIPAYILWQHIQSVNVTGAALYIAAIAGVFAGLYFLTSDSFWASQKRNLYHLFIWLSAIAFGLIHLIAFSQYDLMLIPYMLCVINVPFLAGCAITYYRVNLGFWWGVALHIFNNLPGIIMLLLV